MNTRTLFEAAGGRPAIQRLVTAFHERARRDPRLGPVFVRAAGARETILTVERPGRAVAELPTFDGRPYPANAAALEPTSTFFLSRNRLERLMLERPHLTRHLLRGLGARLRHLVGLLEALSFQQVVGRLCAYLLERSAGGLPFQLETNATIAARLGTVGEPVTRKLARLSGSGLVELAGRAVVGLKRAGPEGYAEARRPPDQPTGKGQAKSKEGA